MRHLPSISVLIVLSALLFACTSGTSEGESRGGLTVRVVGRLVPAASNAAESMSGLVVRVLRVSKQGDEKPVVDPVTTGSDGKFAIQDVSMSPWEETYVLKITDPKGRWQSRSLALFTLTGGTIDYKDIALSALTGVSLSSVKGAVLDALTFQPIRGVTLSLTGGTEEQTVTTADDGTFNLRVPAARYSLGLSAKGLSSSTAPMGWVSETGRSGRTLTVSADPENQIGQLLLAPAAEGDGVTLVFTARRLSGDARADAAVKACEDRVLAELSDKKQSGFGRLTLPQPELDLNHAWGENLERWPGASGLLRPDGFGMGTSFWPGFLGTPSDGQGEPAQSWDGTRVVFGADYTQSKTDDSLWIQEYKVGDQRVLEARSTDLSDQRVESLVIHQRNPAAAFPKQLGFYYVPEDTGNGSGSAHYPAGMMFQSLRVDCWERAEVRVYQNNALARSFTYERAAGSAQAGGAVTWSPLLVEYGYTKASPTTDDQVYLNVLPLADLELRDAPAVQGYQALEATDPSLGWKKAPKSITQLVGSPVRVYFAGEAKAGGSQLSWVEKNASPAQDSKWPSTAEVLAMTVDDLAPEHPPVLAVRDNGVTKIVRGTFGVDLETLNPSFDTATCGKPQALARYGDDWVVGTDRGLYALDCVGNVPGQELEFEHGPAVTAMTIFSSGRSKGIWALAGTTEGTVRAFNLGGSDVDGQPPRWRSLDLPDIDRAGMTWNPVIGFAAVGSDLVIATQSHLLLNFSRSFDAPTLDIGIPAGIGTDSGALGMLTNSSGQTVSPTITALGSFEGRVYMGTAAGIYELDFAAAYACEDRTFQSKCLRTTTLHRLEGFPAIAVTGFASGADRFFVSTEKGLFELRSARPRLTDSTTLDPVPGSAHIAGLGAIAEHIPTIGDGDGGSTADGGMDGGTTSTPDAGLSADAGTDAGPACPANDYMHEIIVYVDDVVLPGYDNGFDDGLSFDSDSAPSDETWGLNAYGSSGPADPSSGDNLANASHLMFSPTIGNLSTGAAQIAIPFNTAVSEQHVRFDYTIAPYGAPEQAVDLSLQTFVANVMLESTVPDGCTFGAKVMVYSTDAAGGTEYNLLPSTRSVLSTGGWQPLSLPLAPSGSFDESHVNQLGIEFSLVCAAPVCSL